MNAALEPTPVLDRVEAYMREAPIRREQSEVVAAFPSDPAAVVRLALAALRKQGKLAHTVEIGKVSYIWIGEPVRLTLDAPPLRQAGSGIIRPLPARITDPSLDKCYEALRDGGQDSYTVGEVATITGVNQKRVRKCLQALALAGKAYKKGKTKGSLYSLKPFENALKIGYMPWRDPDPTPEPEPAANDARAPTAERLAITLKEIRPTPDWPSNEIPVFTASRPTAAMTADRRIVIVNGGRGTILDHQITTAVIELVRKFDEALERQQ